MYYVRDRLLGETVKFLEKCQTMILNGKIDVVNYWSLTTYKFGFIDNMMKSEEETVFVNKELRTRICNLFDKDNYIYDSNKRIVLK